MPETLLILLAGGLMLPAAVWGQRGASGDGRRAVGLVGVIVVGAALVCYAGRDVPPAGSRVVQDVQRGLVWLTGVAVVGHLSCAAKGWSGLARGLSCAATLAGVLAGSHLLHEAMVARGTAGAPPPKALAMALQTLSCGGAAAVAGAAVAAGVLATRWGGAPVPAAASGSSDRAVMLRRVVVLATASTAVRAVGAVAGPLLVENALHPVPDMWPTYGPLIVARWMVGFVVPLGLLHAANARLRSGRASRVPVVLGAAAVAAVAGEATGLHLVEATGLPF